MEDKNKMQAQPVPLKGNVAREIIAALGQGVTIVDTKGRFQYVNAAYARMVGRSPSDLLGQTPAEVTHPDDLHFLVKARRQRHTGQTTTYETRLLRPDGTIVYVQITGVPRWHGEEVSGALSIVTDVTALKQAEEAYHALVENSLQGLLIIQNFRIVFASGQVEQISGYSPAELKAFSPEEFLARVFETDKEAMQQRLVAHLAGADAPPRMEFRLWHKNGELRWVEVYTRHIMYRNKPAAQVAYLDITERKTAEQVLQTSEEKHRRLLNSIRSPIVALTKKMVILYCNQAFSEFVGQPIAQLEGQRLLSLFPEFANTNSYAAYLKTLETGEMQEVEGQMQQRHLQIRVHPTPWGILAITDDVSERKQAEEALRQSERQYQTLFAAAQRQAQELTLLDKVRTALAQELNLKTIFRTVVEAIVDTFNYTRVNIYIRQGDMLVLQHAVGYRQVLTEIPITIGINGRVTRTGQPVLLKDVHSDPDYLDTSEDSVSEICVPLFDQETVVGTLNVESGQGQILTEDDLDLVVALSKNVNIAIYRAGLYTEIQQSREQYRGVVNSVGDVIFQTDADGKWTFLNNAWTEITGFPIAESLGENFLDYVHPNDREKNTAEFLPLIERKKEYCRHEVRYLTKAGGHRWIEVHAKRIEDEDTRILGTSGLLRDVTERKQREREQESFAAVTRALRQANTRAQMLPIILDRTLDLLQAGGVMFVTHLHENSWQIELARGDWQSLSEQELPSEASLARFEADTGDIYISEDVRSDLPSKLVSSLSPHYAVMGAPVIRNDNVVGVIWVGRQRPFLALEAYPLKAIAEITAAALARAQLLETLEQQVIERTQELKIANERLQELDQLKTKFMHDVSHELRTPAAAINVYLDLLSRGHDDKRESYLGKLRANTHRLNQIIESILQFSRLTETAAHDMSLLDLNELTATVVDQYRDGLKNANLHLAFTPNPAFPFVRGNTILLSQAIGYLLDNAIKYTPDGLVTINIYPEEDAQMVCVQIQDTGIGIDQEELANVFDRFYRGQQVGQLTTPGAGLGLSLARQIAVQHGGRIAIDSELDVGTTVRFCLPVTVTGQP